MRVATTEQLKALNEVAVKRGYNRAVTDEFLEGLRPEAVHVCVLSLLHEHIAGEPADPHIRSMWKIDVGKEQWEEAFIDCDLNAFLGLAESGGPAPRHVKVPDSV